MTIRIAGLLGTISLIAFTATAAQAQVQPEDDSSTDIVVTAQKRSESIQDVPIAVTAISGDQLVDRGIRNSVDIASATPNLQINETAGAGTQPAIFLRGIGLNDFSLNNSGPVALYLDEVNLSSFGSQNFSLFDMERVEVLRGPQGTLYGKNTTGGAVNFVTRMPGAQWNGGASASYASFGNTRIEAAVGGPLSDSVRVRVAGLRNTSRGYFTNLLTGEKSNGADLWAVRGVLQFLPSEGLEIVLRGRVEVNNSRFTWYDQEGTLDPLTGAQCAPAQVLAHQCTDAFGYSDQDPVYQGRFSRNEDMDNEVKTTSARISYDFGSVQLTSITAYARADNFFPEDTDVSPNHLVEVTLGAQSDTFSQELRANGESGDLKWIAGLYYVWERIDQDQTADVLRDIRPDPAAFFSRHLNRQSGNLYAAFGQIDYSIAENLTLTAGVRLSQDNKSFRTVLQFEEPGLIIPGFDTSLRISDSNFSWRLGLNYDATADWLLYANASRGFKGGGFNGSFIFDPAQNVPYRPEILTAYEIGSKQRFAGGRVTLNTAAFLYDYRDAQVFSIVSSAGFPVSLLNNAPKARIYGAEAELSVRARGGFSFNAALGLINTEFTRFPSFTGDFTGNRLSRAPSVTASGSINYEHDLGGFATLRASADVSYQSMTFFGTENSPLGQQEGYALAGARLGLEFAGGISVALFGRNLFDKYYAINRTPLLDFGLVQVVPGTPRVIGAEVSFQF
ncbi:MAG: TonB-dependent receptor [Sphingopyxis sp.]